MKKRIAVGVGLLVLVCTGATLLDPYCRLLGLVRRESFYQGKPTIYWERQIAGADERARTGNGNSNFIFDWIEKRTGYSIGNSQPDLDVLRIDPTAIPVLRELLKRHVAYVRWNAAIVLCAEKMPNFVDKGESIVEYGFTYIHIQNNCVIPRRA